MISQRIQIPILYINRPLRHILIYLKARIRTKKETNKQLFHNVVAVGT